MYVYYNIEALSRNHYCSGKAISITYSERGFVALGIQHAMRVRCIMLSSVACTDYLINATIFGKIIEH
jgi:hypothetical protein